VPASADAASGERGVHRALVVAVTVLAFSVLYAPQPLLPLFARRFGVSEPTAALLITATLLPLSFAPLSYGYLLQRVSPVRLLRIGVLCLGALELLFAAADRFPLLLAVRFLQGLLLPAVLTSLMTYIALAAPPERRSRDLAGYVGASIVGGYLGRLLSGLGAAYTDWRLVFVLLGAGLLLAAIPLGRLRPVQRAGAAEPPSPRLVLEVLREGGYTPLFVAVFAFFFVFASLLNFLPFRLEEIQPGAVELWRGLVYTGYLFGVITALTSGRIARRLGGSARALTVGFGVYAAALACTIVADLWVLFGVMFVFCGAMFLMHAVATGEANRGGGERTGIINGLYLVFYYSGGVLGSFLPGIAYERFGWTAFVGVLLAVAAVGWGAAASLLLRPAAGPSAVPAETGTRG
jgi:YNFM family putative membrane transporter